MLNLYQSNMLEALARLYLAVREPSRDPLEPETLLVPSQGMQRWLAYLGLLFALLVTASLGAGTACAQYQIEKVNPQSQLFRLTSGIVEFSFEYNPLYNVADIILQRPPALDLAPFRPQRFH